MVSDREELDDLVEELTLIWMEKIKTVVIRGVANLKENVCPDEKCKALTMFADLILILFISSCIGIHKD